MDNPNPLTNASSTSNDERRLRGVIEATPNAMVMVDLHGQVVLVNAQTERLFGHSREELLSMRVEQLIPDRFRARHEGYRHEFFGDAHPRAMGAGRDLYGLRKDGTEVPIEIGLSPLDTDEGTYVLASIIDITERKRSEERLVQVVEAAPNAMIMVNAQGQIVLVNSQTERSFGYDRKELLTMKVEDLIPERLRRAHESFRSGYFDQPDRRDMGVGRELFGRRKDGSEIPIEIGLNPIQIMEESFVLASVIDISERLIVQAAENSFRQDHLRRSILDTLPFSIIATDIDGTIVTANPAAERLLGYRQQELVGLPISVIYAVAQADREASPHPGDAATTDDEREATYRTRDGRCIPVNEEITVLQSEDGELTGHLTTAYDITKRKEAQAVVRHLATHDALTNLPNRIMLFDYLVETIRHMGEEPRRIAVLLLDLDHFKRVNDSLGHHAGDALLVAMAARLSKCVRDEDLVARLGGDEFVIVFNNPGDAQALTGRIKEFMHTVLEPLKVNQHELIISASMGGAIYPMNGESPEELLKKADTAMYHAKSSGRNNFQWFLPSMVDEANDKIALASALRRALNSDQLSLVYQPQISLESGEVIGMEALARWNSPELGTIPPDRLIPVAEDSGMIAELGEWVLRQACAVAAAIQRALGRPLRLAVNVSPRQFHDRDWLAVIQDTLDNSGFNPAHLDLEITEGIFMEGPGSAVGMLHALRDLGIKIVVDDFGTGFSGLGYLTRFPIDRIKIDRSFVRDIMMDKADAAIVDTIIVMAHTLGMTVVAEGIETADQEAYLHDRGCDEGQGFHYSPATRASDFVATATRINGAAHENRSTRVLGSPAGTASPRTIHA